MSRCPTDGPVLKSILGLYRPTADCLLPLSLSLSLAVSTFYHFPSPPIRFPFCFFTPTATYLLHLSLPLLSRCQSLWLYRSLSHTPSPSLPRLSLIWGLIQPSTSFSLASHGVIAQIALSALMLHVSLYHCLCLPLLFCFLLSHSPLVFLLQAANGEQNHHDRERSLPGPEGAGETVSKNV